MVKPISKIAAAIAPSATLAISAMAKQMKADGIDVVSFGAGEPDFNTPENIKEAGIAAIQANKTRYTPAAGIIELRKAICNRMKEDLGLEYEPSQVVVASGAKHNVYLAIMTCCDPGDEVVVAAPYWLSYAEMIRMAGAVPVEVRATAEHHFKITADELDTARRRTTGSMDALKAAGFPEKQIYKVPTKSNDIPGAFDAANSMLVQHPEVKHWLVVGMNDNTVLGGVRATEGQGFKAPDIIGIGINGVDAVSELSKAQATGFYGSLLPSPDVHGYKSSEMLYNWVTKGVEPPKFTEVTDVVLITRDNFKEELAKKGLGGK